MILKLQNKFGRFTHLNLNVYVKETGNQDCGIGEDSIH